MGGPALDDYANPIGSVERKRERMRAYYARNKERVGAIKREEGRRRRAAMSPEDKARAVALATSWRQSNVERAREAARRPERRAYAKAWRDQFAKDHPEEHRRRMMAVRLKSRYGVPIDRYDAMLAAQGGVCAVCRQTETLILSGTLAMLSVDHDHTCCPGKKSCGKCVRGLLCSRCNNVMGRSGDNPVLLRELADYIETARNLTIYLGEDMKR